MKSSKYLGIMLAATLVFFFGCCCQEEDPEEEIGEPYVPKEHIIEIVENQDAPKVPNLNNLDELVVACKPAPNKIGVWHGDTVSFVSKYEYLAYVTMAPGPFIDEIATFPVQPGETLVLTVGEEVTDGYWYGFQLSCDPSGPGPSMGGDDPDIP
jgi:hypothetical protein